ncbi:MAG TPA: 3-hydroxyacyl-CoA dehydrogenase NAD-binding domain-containing protein [Pseudolysinimonas sp.]|nr:3-hydroxyacyl-CoA dehydrogenase NAD-binding domain-containing protein [Pseudolysinimonas sp.]
MTGRHGGEPSVALVGAGRMGRGMAVAIAFAGIPVALIDVKRRTPEELDSMRESAIAEIDGHLRALVRLGALPDDRLAEVANRVQVIGRSEASAALAAADIVFEGASETLDAKREVFQFINEHVDDDAVIASTTSTIISTDLAQLLAKPERFLNAHWLNPAFLMPIVEVSPHPGTDPAAVDRIDAFLRLVGKHPIRVAPTAGYIVPRLQALIFNEAARMIDDGVATPAEIDEAVRLGFGFRFATVGPLEFIDISGLEMVKYASGHLSEALGERFQVAPAVETRIADGRLGIRSGTGFYPWADGADNGLVEGMITRQYALLELLGVAPQFDGARRETRD